MSRRDTARTSLDTALVVLATSLQACYDSTGAVQVAFHDVQMDVAKERALSDSALHIANVRGDSLLFLGDSVVRITKAFEQVSRARDSLLGSAIHTATPSRFGLGVVAGLDQDKKPNVIGGVVWSILSPNQNWGIGVGAGVDVKLHAAIALGATYALVRFAP